MATRGAGRPLDRWLAGRGRGYRGPWRAFRRSPLSLLGGGIVALYILAALAAPWLAPFDPARQFPPPAGEHHPLPPLSRDGAGHLFLLGTDGLGRDLLSRAIWGIRTLLELGVGSVGIALVLGLALGGLAGLRAGSWWDEVIMRGVDFMLSFPTLILIIAIVGALGGRAGGLLGSVGSLMVVIGVIYSPRLARVARAAVLREMAEDYVAAARAIGSGGWRILVREVLPNAGPPLIVQGSLMLATTVLTSASLSFLGLGLRPPTPSLGLMLSEARGYLLWGAWWYVLVPGGLISLAVLGFNLLGDGLRDALDPRAP